MKRATRSEHLWKPRAWLVLAAALAGGHSAAQTTERVSVATDGTEANHFSSTPSISNDGRYVAFGSRATNLVPGDTNGFSDIFVRDRSSSTTERVSLSSTGGEINHDSGYPVITPDGRYVAFSTLASNLVVGDTNGAPDVFVHDRSSGTTVLVSVADAGTQGNGASVTPSLSGDGRFVAFMSNATTFVGRDTNVAYDVFVHDGQTGTTVRVSVASDGSQGNSASSSPTISADGRFVTFSSSASNLVANDTNGNYDVFVHDRWTSTTERVSTVTGGAQANGISSDSWISADGRFVAFHSSADNLVANDMNGFQDVFLHDRQTGTTERVSLSSPGSEGNGISRYGSTSADGRFVAFYSDANDLVPFDTNEARDVFVRDRLTASLRRVSLGANGEQANYAQDDRPTISGDGRLVAFSSFASNLVPNDTNVTMDAFVRDLGVPPIVAGCFGDGSGAACPCGNAGAPGRGCENSAPTGGAELVASGTPSLSADSLVLTASAELPTALTILLQGTDAIAPLAFGDGLRCAGGALLRLYVNVAVGGIVSVPQGGDPSISMRSAALGDEIPLGATRHYQSYYRDPDLSFCPGPAGNSWNASNSLSAVWSP